MGVDIIEVAKKAQAARALDPSVIDATVGMFYDEDKKIGGMPIVTKIFKSLSNDQIFPYSSMDGGIYFHSLLLSWLFRDKKEQVLSTLFSDVCATPGGSGAIGLTFETYGSPDESILVSDIRWQYDRFSERAGLNLFEFELFDGNHFNLGSFKKKLTELCSRQKRVIVVINDPCHNPSGYTMTDGEFEAVILEINKHKNNEIIFLYDLAYLEFSLEKDNRKKLLLLTLFEPHVLTIIAFSGSKTFGAYGLRLGAAVALSKNKEIVTTHGIKFRDQARGLWTTLNTSSIAMFEKILDKENQPEFIKQLASMRNQLAKRGYLFVEQAKIAKLKHFPFVNGSYILIPHKDPDGAVFKLMNHGIFAIPLNNGIRIALCSLSLKEVDGLPEKISKII